MLTNGSMKKFLFEENGIENLFKNVAQITGAATILKLSIAQHTDDIIMLKILAFLSSFIFFGLSALYAVHRLIIPFLKACYGDNERYAQMEDAGWRTVLSVQGFIYFGFVLIYVLIINYCFDALIKVF